LQIRSFFDEEGTIVINNNYNFVVYKVSNLNGIVKVIIPHFEKFPFISQKQSDFLLFKDIVESLNKGDHLNKEGLNKIISLKASLNKGLSYNIYFSDIIKAEKPKVNLPLNVLNI